MTRHAPGGTATLAGRTVARVGFGAMQLAGFGDRPAPDRAQSLAVLRRAFELGVDHVDTAAFYGQGLANGLLREALAEHPDVLVATKVGAEHHPGEPFVLAQRPEQLRAAVEENLRQLGVDRLDLVNLRRGDRGPGLVAAGDQVVDLDDQLAELVALRDAGTVGAVGLSTVSAAQLEQALPAGIACVQNVFSLVDRRHEAELERCRALGIAWVPFFPLGSAAPGLPKVVDQPAVQQVAARLGATPAQVGLAWLLAQGDDVLLIPGTTSPEHLAQNVAAGDLQLDAAALAELDAVRA